jgi:LAS superfamily LD-carboxypeptidase LdcB
VAADVDSRIEAALAESAALAQTDQRLAKEIAEQQARLAARTRGITRSVTASRSSGRVPLATVRGITVHRDIADNLEALLAAAEADGFVFGGGGYRDPEDQRRLRRAHCPDAERSSASSCHPPTARPGHSMHEQGLAVDFTYNGAIISSRSNPGYRWLAANASRFGFYNLPSEPWHWSTNGQ